MKTTRNTLLISGLAAAGLLAVWYFLLRKSTPATPDTLGSTLNAGTTTTDGAASLGGTPASTDLAGTVKGLFDNLVATFKPATTTGGSTSATPTLWAKVKQETGNLWTNLVTGQQQTLEKAHNPNLAATLTAGDKLALATTENEPLAKVMAANTASTSAASAALAGPAWQKIKVPGENFNTWLNTATGQKQDLLKGHNPLKPETLTAVDRTRLASEANEAANQVSPGWGG